MTNNNMSRWCVLHTAPKSERKLMQRLNAAGYTAFCPMQIVFKKWKGQTKEVFAPLFPGCVFVEETTGVASFVAEGKYLFVCADKAELPAKFVHLLK